MDKECVNCAIPTKTILCGKLGMMCKERCEVYKCIDCIIDHYLTCGVRTKNGFLEHYINKNNIDK